VIKLQSMSQERFDSWRERLWVLYRQELIDAGHTEEAAAKNVADTIADTMPDGVLVAGNFVFDLVHEDETVGVTWLVQNEDAWSIYDIEVDEGQRGKGLGRQAMKAIEEHVRGESGKTISLSVFGFNKAARSLYESEGYETVRVSMKKSLD
jgi:ribosomal protein S18 acetylase RimI-like enzyme